MGKGLCTGGNEVLCWQGRRENGCPALKTANGWLEREMIRADADIAQGSLCVTLWLELSIYFTDGETEAWGSNVICLRSHSWLVVELGFELSGSYWLHYEQLLMGLLPGQ